MSKTKSIPSQQVANVSPADRTPRQVGRDFRRLLEQGYSLKADGKARKNPLALLQRGYTPRYQITLFGTRYFLCNQRDADGLKIMPAYVIPGPQSSRYRRIYARVFYKDSSLVWRSASHYINTPEEEWIGKGAVRWVEKRGTAEWASVEETTNLPLELQAALDDVSHRGAHSQNDNQILSLVLRNAPIDRVWPYRDFEKPREHAMSLSANRVNNNKPVAWFGDDDDPGSLQFEPGFAPDFSSFIDVSRSRSAMYGGEINKFRFASANGKIQYMFVAGPTHVWLIHPQPFTTELSSYGLRTVDVIADEELFIPGYEFADNSGHGEIDDQIPPGFAGEPCPVDPDRADASPWNNQLSVVIRFRRWLAKWPASGVTGQS